jgi:hypothetical protein
MPEERLISPSPPAPVPEIDPVEIPLPVVPDWDRQARSAVRMARLIDRHLDYEAYCRSGVEAERLSPRRLCPQQRVDLVTDLLAVVGSPQRAASVS